MGLEEEIEALEEEIAETPYNKSTEEHIGRLKAKLAEKKEQLEQQQSSSGGGGGYAVEKTGDATVALVGFPSVGKSTLLNTITNTDNETAAYEFTTVDINPGMLQYNGANIQILDVPGLVEGAAGGRGDGQQVLSVVRTADLVVFVLSAFEVEKYERLVEELQRNKIRLDTEPPNISVDETGSGGLQITTTNDVSLSDEAIAGVLREHGYINARVSVMEDTSLDRLVDGIMDNRVYMPSFVVVNKVDLIDESYAETVKENLHDVGLDPSSCVFTSFEENINIDEFKQRIWEELNLTRLYLDKPGRGVDYEEPLVLNKREPTVQDACAAISDQMIDNFRFARVSGSSVDHEEQQVGLDHVLHDEDVLRILT